jgi:hypothetical protein
VEACEVLPLLWSVVVPWLNGCSWPCPLDGEVDPLILAVRI